MGQFSNPVTTHPHTNEVEVPPPPAGNETGNTTCSLLLVLVFGVCFHLLFVACSCSSWLVLVFEIESGTIFLVELLRFMSKAKNVLLTA